MRVLFATVEMSPLAKVGGLGDVAGSLPKALVERGHDVRVILPLHASIDTAEHGFRRILADVSVETPRGPERTSVWEGEVGGVTTYLVEAADLFERPAIYGEPDDAQRFLFFSDAVLATVPQLGGTGGGAPDRRGLGNRTGSPIQGWQPEVLHLQDWHTAFIAARLHGNEEHPLARAATVYTIHNLALRGDFDAGFAEANRLVIPSVAGVDDDVLRSGMALGILRSGLISTVSETYAREILTPEYGAGLDPLLREREADLFGIVNGIDPAAFDPATDPHIPARYSADDPGPKREDKAALQRELGLPERADVPLVGVVNRLFWQKGMDIAAEGVAMALAEVPLQFVALGTGERQYEEQLLALQARYPEAVAVRIDFDTPLGQRIYAGSDLFLMPSRYEPCGLGQMIAMRFGSVPVVRQTGGLVDTVPDDDAQPGEGVGFSFGLAEPAALADALRRAVRAYGERERWREIVHRGMTRDFSWGRQADQYVALYEKAIERAAAR